MEINDGTDTLDINALPAAEWRIDDDGLLTIAPPAGCDRAVLKMDHYYRTWVYANQAPWDDWASDLVGVYGVEDVLVRPGVAAAEGAAGLFGQLWDLVRADVSELDVSGVEDMRCMFYYCPSLRSLDLSGWDVSGVWGMADMFCGCSSLGSLDLSGWDVSGVRDMDWMFYGCSSLKSLDLSGWDVSRVVDMHQMFRGCSSLKSLDLSGWDVSRVRNMDGMFDGCGDVELVLDGCSEESVARLRVLMDEAVLPAAEWHIDGDGLLVVAPPAGCDRAVLKKEHDDLDRDVVPWRSRTEDIKGVLVGPGVVAAVDACWLFGGCENLVRADVSELDVSRVENMNSMFKGCSSLKSLDLSGWDVSRVRNMWSMFEGCSSLESLDLSGWDVSRVVNMSWMFSGCSSLGSLDLSGWDVSCVEEMGDMFSGCKNASLVLDGCSEASAAPLRALLDAASLPAAEWHIDGDGLLTIAPPEGCDRAVLATDGSNYASAGSRALWRPRADEVKGVLVRPGVAAAGDAACLFGGLKNLERVDVSALDVSGVENMRWMFEGCSSLESLDLGGWDVSRVWGMFGMFEGCSSFESLNLAGWDVSGVRDMGGMFDGCGSVELVLDGCSEESAARLRELLL